MDKFDRFQQLHRIFKARRMPVSLVDLSREMECSAVTVKRQISSMRDYLDAPIEYSRSGHGYYYADDQESFELPGLWMTSQELQSLVVISHILEALDEGLLAKEFLVFDKHIERLLQTRGISTSLLAEKIKWIPLEKHFTNSRTFSKVSEALLSGSRISIAYESAKLARTTRVISPIHLIYYRENWYLDAWCHLRGALRSFMLSRIKNAEIAKGKTKTVPKKNLEKHYASSYGIFSGEPKHVARLIFSAEVAHEVSSHQWHPDERSEWLDGKYILDIPYNKDDELIRDVLKYGRSVEVVEPRELRIKVKKEVDCLAKLYH